jgi:hypothetical protein
MLILQIINYSVGLYKFLRIESDLLINKLKLPEGALLVIMWVEFKFSLIAQTSRSFSLQWFSMSVVTFKLLCIYMQTPSLAYDVLQK